MSAAVAFRETKDFTVEDVLPLYRAVGWSSAEKPDELYKGLINSTLVVTAWSEARLIGLCSAISDGHLVAYYPHALVAPDFQGQGIGRELLRRARARFEHLHQQVVIADGAAVSFYEKCGFTRAGRTEPMWIYDGEDH